MGAGLPRTHDADNAFHPSPQGEDMKTILKPIAVAALALAAMSGAGAKTLVYCAEGGPENFYPGVNTTGTSFETNEPIYNRIVEFERGGTKVVPSLAEKWDISPGGEGGAGRRRGGGGGRGT